MQDAESAMITDIAGRRSVLFLVPAAAHSNIAVEAWEAAGQWDIQTEDGETYAVLYDAYEEHPEQRQTLTNLKSRIAAASASDAFANSRIANVSGLTQHYRDTGAYDDITPGDNDTDTFVSTEPPPVQLCKGSDAVGTSTDFHLYRECSALLGLKVELAGTTTLNWSQNLDIGSWTGVTIGGTLQRVTGVNLPSSNLNGTIPTGLERPQSLKPWI